MMFCTWTPTLLMTCLMGLAANWAALAYGGPGINQALRANRTDFGYAPAVEPIGFSSTGSPVANGEIVLFSPSGTVREARYSLNGVPYEMKPGAIQRLKNDRVWKVEMNSGTGQTMTYTLVPGTYKFKPTGLGMSMGLFATQDRPDLTTVASATAGVSSVGLAAPSVRSFATISAPSTLLRESAETRLALQRLLKPFDQRPGPPIAASQWLNTSQALSPQQFRDKVVLLDFWGSWCGPCVRNLPKVQALYEKYKDRGLIVVGVHSAQGAESVAPFLARHSCSFPIAVDTGETAARYRIEEWPTYFLIDKSGQQTWKFGHVPPSEQQIENLLRL